MTWRASILLLLFPASLAAEPARASAILTWNNRETLAGEIAEATATSIAWKTPMFEDPMQLHWHALHRIDLPQAPIPLAEPFSIALRDGSHIVGDPTSFSENSVSVRSVRHGDFVLKRSEVASMRRIRGGSLTIAGPVGDVGWESRAGKEQRIVGLDPSGPKVFVAMLKAGPGGSLVLPYWNRDAFFRVNLPERVDIEFRVKSSARPEFQLSLADSTDKGARIETWDDELVLASANQFKAIRRIGGDERQVALRVCWDRKTGKCAAYSAAGELLTEWKTPEQQGKEVAGLLLHNKGRDLTLEFLRVREWDGKAPPKVDATKPRVELTDGRIIEGKVMTGLATSITFKAHGSEAVQSFPIASVDAVFFSPEPTQAVEMPITMSFADGTILKGAIESIKDGTAAIKLSATDKPLPSRMDGFRQMLIGLPKPEGSAPEPLLTALDKIVIQQNTLHGKLTGEGDDRPRWLPVGGVKPAIVAKAFAGEINRALAEDSVFPDTPGLFHTSTGDVLPGQLRALDQTGVEFDSDIVEITKLTTANLNAIQFGVAGQPNLNGFADAGWRIIKGNERTVARKDGTLTMEPGTSIGHPAGMQGSEIKFSVVPKSTYSTIRLRLFCEGTEPTKATNLLLYYWANRIQAGRENADGQWENQTQTVVPIGKPVEIRLGIDEKQVELRINDILTRKFPINPAMRAGVGLIIEPTGTFGNEATAIALSDFSTHAAPGRTWLPDVAVETKFHALTIPRFRKDAPPKHALIANNGDVLRGEIEAITATHFGFRSGLETLRVPRDRVKAAIWLKKPDADAPTTFSEGPALKLLDTQIRMNSRFNGAGLSSLIAVLQREVGGLKFKLPEKQDTRRVAMQFGGQTVGEALEHICSLFDLKYRFSEDGTILIEAPSASEKELISKTYWLKPGTFPGDKPVKEILAEKGLGFPSGSDLTWRPDAAQLSMANIEENHAKLAALLKTEFGGILGTPTHWLLLTNGARLGMEIDKFDPDFISGQHPLYGRCKVPVSQVHVIRTTMPEATAAMKSLKDWRLTFAPEPVLPETGGESSPSLGKEAKPFKLAMLGGGDFDLGAEKGKVVVLDFWATWCLPCIKSLPGIIKVMADFPPDRVKLIGVNQGEPADFVKRFLEARDWKLAVAMDSNQSVARQFGVDGIPHTVIVGPDGKVAWVKTGYSPEGELEAAAAVKKLLEPAAPPAATP